MTNTTALAILSELVNPAPTFNLASLKPGDLVTSTHVLRYVSGVVVAAPR